MRTFQVNKNISVVCRSEKTSYGFRHLATLIVNGNKQDTAKCCYYNRTWESYEFESVLKKLAEKTQNKALKRFLKTDHTDNSDLKMVSAIAGFGEIFGKTTKEKNDWKARMIKAGLGNQGLEMPEDWDSLSEKDKETRLNGVIEVLKSN